MVIKDNKKIPQSTACKTPLYVCEKCHYKTCDRSNWAKHKRTAKHKKIHMVNDGNNVVPQTTTYYTCVCGKSYNYMSGLSRHKKTCTYEPHVVETETQNQIVSKDNDKIIILQLNSNYPNAQPVQYLIDQIKNNPNCITHDPKIYAQALVEALSNQPDDRRTIRVVKDTMYVKYEETFKEDKEGEVFDTIKKETEQDQLSKAFNQFKNQK